MMHLQNPFNLHKQINHGEKVKLMEKNLLVKLKFKARHAEKNLRPK